VFVRLKVEFMNKVLRAEYFIQKLLKKRREPVTAHHSVT